jgi:hypothetical protein
MGPLRCQDRFFEASGQSMTVEIAIDRGRNAQGWDSPIYRRQSTVN